MVVVVVRQICELFQISKCINTPGDRLASSMTCFFLRKLINLVASALLGERESMAAVPPPATAQEEDHGPAVKPPGAGDTLAAPDVKPPSAVPGGEVLAANPTVPPPAAPAPSDGSTHRFHAVQRMALHPPARTPQPPVHRIPDGPRHR